MATVAREMLNEAGRLASVVVRDLDDAANHESIDGSVGALLGAQAAAQDLLKMVEAQLTLGRLLQRRPRI